MDGIKHGWDIMWLLAKNNRKLFESSTSKHVQCEISKLQRWYDSIPKHSQLQPWYDVIPKHFKNLITSLTYNEGYFAKLKNSTP